MKTRQIIEEPNVSRIIHRVAVTGDRESYESHFYSSGKRGLKRCFSNLVPQRCIIDAALILMALKMADFNPVTATVSYMTHKFLRTPHNQGVCFLKNQTYIIRHI